MTTETEIANMAQGYLAISKEIENIETDTGTAAYAFNLYYDNTLAAILQKWKPDLAHKYANLALVESDPNDDYEYSYRYPSDCLCFLRIRSGFGPAINRIPYIISSDSTGRLIWTNEGSTATGIYIQNFGQESDFSPMLTEALAMQMAVKMAPILEVNVPAGLRREADMVLRDAISADRNQRGEGQRMESSATRIRGGSDTFPPLTS